MPVNHQFLRGYDAMLDRWPVPVRPLDVPGRHGTTRVTVCGVDDGPAVVLIHGGGATSTAWWSTVGGLAASHRVCAVDVIGDRGRSVYDGAPIRGEADLMGWLDETLDAAGVPDAVLVGHSYGGWLVTRYALHAPDRVNGLVLLDPTECLRPTRLSFRLRAVPLLFGRRPGAVRSFLRWETGGRELDAQWLDLWATPFGGPTKLVLPRQVSAPELGTLAMPTLVLLAGRSRQTDPARMAEVARRQVPKVEVVTLPDATHFTMPQQHPDEIGAALREFL
jgi:pimeloyl-ACP methyl ester carboxylesterase